MTKNITLSRRALLISAPALASACATSPGNNSPAVLPNRSEQKSVRTDVRDVSTQFGKVRGYWRNGVFIWKGIPYAASTAGKARFRPPTDPESWKETRLALNYGPICPVGPAPPLDMSSNEWPFLIPNGPLTAQSEDCLRVNIWSSDTDRSAPVMVWLHPDGFGGGSSQKYLASDGENLARYQDVVVVSLNHRVGPLGFTNFAQEDGPLSKSANVGMLDIVHALRWIKTNISAFGGDPSNVTVFGQSGGGFKISTLLAMPSAVGLFHKAIIQSGARIALHEPRQSSTLGQSILEELSAIGDPQSLPVETVLATSWEVSRRRGQEYASNPETWSPPGHWFEPTIGQPELPNHPFSKEALQLHPDVPVICGTVKDEASPSVNAPDLENLSWGDAVLRLEGRFAGKAEAGLSAVRREFPSASPIEALSIASSFRFRAQALEVCRRLASRGTAPVYNYVFEWDMPVFDGRPRAYHTSDIAFVFANTDLVDLQTGGGPDARALATTMSGMWATFARVGDPNGESKREASWRTFTPKDQATLLFKNPISVKRNRDLDWIEALSFS